jgi:hypothetical protein
MCQCEPACDFAHGSGDCYRGVCRLKDCDEGYLNCDGVASNGCELEDLVQPLPIDALPVKRFEFAGDIETAPDVSWAELPSYRINSPCEICAHNPANNVVPISPMNNWGTRPQPMDLSGSIKVGWNQGGIWIRVLTMDDEWFLTKQSEALPVEGYMLTPSDARNMDNFEVLWNTHEEAQGENTDRMLFVSAEGTRSELLLEKQRIDQIPVAVRELGPRCRATYLRLQPGYLIDVTNAPLALGPGQSYGLNVALNDFDVVPESAGTPAQSQRQHQLFLFAPMQPNLPVDAPDPRGQYYAGPWWGGKITLQK